MLCAGSALLLTPVVLPAKSQPATPSEVVSFSYWSIKPWFLTEGKLAAVLIIPSSWGSPTVCSALIKAIFWRRCQGERGFLQGESLISNLFTLLLFCLVYFILSCLLHYIKNTKKLVSIIAFISVASMSSPVTMSPEEMIFTFKQGSEESVKEAWSRINKAYDETGPRMTLGLLLSSFYFGLTLRYRYALDTLVGGDFLQCDGDLAFNAIKN